VTLFAAHSHEPATSYRAEYDEKNDLSCARTTPCNNRHGTYHVPIVLRGKRRCFFPRSSYDKKYRAIVITKPFHHLMLSFKT
jgi:hypothetical protein